MIKNLDEAISHCIEVAEEQENKAKSYPRPDKSVKGSGRKYNACIKCAEEHRQLAEWLRELKDYRDDYDYKTLKIKLENAEDVIRGLQEELREAREEMRWG